MFFFQNRKRRARRKAGECRNYDPFRLICAVRLDDLMKPPELKPLCDLELFSRRGKLGIRKENGFLLGEMKNEPLSADLRVSSEQFDLMEERDTEPRAVSRNVRIRVDIKKNGNQKKQCAHKERIYKKFAHIRNMGECVKIM